MKLRRHRLGKLALATAFALAGLLALYGIGVNLLLSTGELARLVSAKPEKLRLEFDHARTLWPGRVHVEGLDLRGRDRRLEWALHIDSADANIALFPLAARRFHATWVRAVGVTFRARFRLDAKDVTADRIARIPPIDGFDAVPLRSVEGEPYEAKKKSFTIRIESVDAKEVREIWIDSFRLAGEMTSAGGFQLGPDRRLEVMPSRLQTGDAALTVGGDPVLTNVSGAADAVLSPLSTEEVKGVAVLRSLTTHSGFVARVGGLRFLRHFLEGKDIALGGGEGTFRGALDVEKGIVKKGSSSHVELGPATLRVGEKTIEARSTLDVAAGDDDAGGWGKGDVLLSSVAFSDSSGKRLVATSASIATTVRIAETDLAEPPHDFTFACDAPSIKALDLGWFGDMLPKDGPFHVDGGSGTARVEAHGSKSEVMALVDLSGAIDFRVAGAAARSDIDGRVRSHVSLAARTVDLSGSSLELKGFAVRGSPPAPDWWGKVKLEGAMLRIDPPSFASTIRTSARDARPILSFYSRMTGSSAAVTTALDLVPDPLVESMTTNLHGSLHLAIQKGSLELRALEVRGANTEVQGELSKRGEAKTGGLLFVAGPASAGVSFEGGRSSAILVDAPRWFERNVRPRIQP